MATTTAFKNLLLGASDIDTLSLHSGDPGSDGSTNEVSGGGYARQSCTFAAAASGERALSAAVDFSTPASQSVTYLGFWASSTFRGSKALTGDLVANSAGQYRVTTTATKLTLADVA